MFSLHRRFTDRFGLLALMTVAVTLPYAVPALWDVVQMHFHQQRTPYLVKPVENQTFYVQFAMIAAVVPFLILQLWKPNLRIRWNLVTPAALLFAIVLLISSAAGENAAYSVRLLLMPFAFLLAFLLIQSINHSFQSLQKVLLVVVLSAAPAALYAIAQSQGFEFLPYSKVVSEATMEEISGKQLISSTLGHPNYLASFISPLAFPALFFALSSSRKLVRASGAITLLLILMALLMGGTRGGWVAVIAGAVPFYILLTMSPRYRRQLLFTAGAAIFIGLLIVLSPIPFFKLQFNISQRLFASKEISARFYYWLIALEMIKNHLLLGVGYGNFNALFWEVVSNFQRQPENAFYRFILEEHIRGVSPGYVHNDYLQIAAESGLLGLGAWFGLWSVLLCQAWQTAKRAASKPRILLFSAALLAYFVGFAVDGLFNFPVQIPVSGFVFWLLLGMWVAFRDVAMKATESVAAGTSQ